MLEFEGEVDWPFPNSAVTIMKYFLGSKTWSSPMSHSLSAIARQLALFMKVGERSHIPSTTKGKWLLGNLGLRKFCTQSEHLGWIDQTGVSRLRVYTFELQPCLKIAVYSFVSSQNRMDCTFYTISLIGNTHAKVILRWTVWPISSSRNHLRRLPLEEVRMTEVRFFEESFENSSCKLTMIWIP